MTLPECRVIIFQETKTRTSALKAIWSMSPCSLLAQHLEEVSDSTGAEDGSKLSERWAWGVTLKLEPAPAESVSAAREQTSGVETERLMQHSGSCLAPLEVTA